MNELDRRSLSGVYNSDRAFRELQDGLGEDGPDAEQSLLGADLRIASPEEIRRDNERKIAELKGLDQLRVEDIDSDLLPQARYVQDMYNQQLELLTKEDLELATSLQHVVIEELRQREDQREQPYEQGSLDSYQENITVIDMLRAELVTEKYELDSIDELEEAETAIEYLVVWRKDMMAELMVKEVERLYELAA